MDENCARSDEGVGVRRRERSLPGVARGCFAGVARWCCLSRGLVAGLASGVMVLGLGSGCATDAPRPARLSSEPLEARKERAAELADRAARLEEKDPDRALELYRDSIAAYPEFPAVWHNLGEFLVSQGELLPAAEALQTASRLQPTEPRSPYLLGKIYFDLRYYDEAKTHFQRAIQRDSNYLPAIRGLIAVVATERSGDASSLRLIERALLLERDPDWQTFFQNQRLRIESELERTNRRVPS
ncbi:MAG: tetratricopeptide repeat protein [Phycisphaerales bacterium]